MSKRKRVIFLVVLGVLAASAVTLLLFGVVRDRRFSRASLPDLPGAASGDTDFDPELLVPGAMKLIRTRLLAEVILPEGGEEGSGHPEAELVASAYETADKKGGKGTQKPVFSAFDQILYGRALVRTGRRRAFQSWQSAFEKAFRSDAAAFHSEWLRCGEMSGEEGAVFSVVQRGPDNWAVTLDYVRTLLEAWRAWGDRSVLENIKNESSRLLPVFSERSTDRPMAAGAQIPLALDAWDDPLPLPDTQAVYPATLIASIDLWTLSALSRIDTEWAPVASDWLETVRNARQEGELPFYASAVQSRGGSYLTLREGRSDVPLKEQLMIALHRAEAGEPDPAFLSFLRSALREKNQLPSGWNAFSGVPLAEEAAPSDYAWVVQLGRASGDTLLCSLARGAWMRHYVSSQKSELFGGWYRSGNSPYTSLLAAQDNLAAVMALR